MKFTYNSFFAGIGGFDLALDNVGMTCLSQTEIDERCCKVLEHHWPNTRRFNDIKKVGKHNLKWANLACGGFPCQGLSAAGKRGGLTDPRSNLFYEFARVIGETRPDWFIIENVPGLFSSNKGEDFVIVLETLTKFGYGVAWRVLDSQYFGVAQRRRRVFIVGHLGDGRAAEVLFERKGMCRDIAPSREAKTELARDIAASLRNSGRGARGWTGDNETGLTVCNPSASHSKKHKGILCNIAPNKKAGRETIHLVVGCLDSGGADRPNSHGYSGMMSACNQSVDAGHIIAGASGSCVRRLTPIECERLQSLPDRWTDNNQSDSVRYRQLGNAVTASVIEWIGRRILMVEKEIRKTTHPKTT